MQGNEGNFANKAKYIKKGKCCMVSFMCRNKETDLKETGNSIMKQILLNFWEIKGQMNNG